MINVYIRNVEEDEGHLLGEFEPAYIPQLVHLFKEKPNLRRRSEV